MATKKVILPEEFVYRYLEDTSGVNHMNRGISTNYDFSPTAPYVIHRVNFYMQALNIRAAKFGSLESLFNGLNILVLNATGNIVQDFGTIDQPITKHNEFGILAGVDITYEAGIGTDDVVLIRWSIDKATEGVGIPIASHGTFRVVVNDDLSGLTEFKGLIQGYYF